MAGPTSSRNQLVARLHAALARIPSYTTAHLDVEELMKHCDRATIVKTLTSFEKHADAPLERMQQALAANKLVALGTTADQIVGRSGFIFSRQLAASATELRAEAERQMQGETAWPVAGLPAGSASAGGASAQPAAPHPEPSPLASLLQRVVEDMAIVREAVAVILAELDTPAAGAGGAGAVA